MNATVIVASRRPPVQYQRSVCELLASGEETVTLRGAGRAAAISLLLAAQMAAKKIVHVRQVHTATVPCASASRADEADDAADDGQRQRQQQQPEDSSEETATGRLAILSVTLYRHEAWKGSRYIPTFVSFATRSSLLDCGSLAESREPDSHMGFAFGVTNSLASLNVEAMLSLGLQREIAESVVAQFTAAEQKWKKEEEKEKTGDSATASPTSCAFFHEDSAALVRSVFLRRSPADRQIAAAVGLLAGGGRSNVAAAVVVVPNADDGPQYLERLKQASRSLIETCCDANGYRGGERGGASGTPSSSRQLATKASGQTAGQAEGQAAGEAAAKSTAGGTNSTTATAANSTAPGTNSTGLTRPPKIAVLRVAAFGFAEGKALGCSAAEVATSVITGLDSGFHLYQAPRLQFICGEDGGDALRDAWCEYTGNTKDALLYTADKFRVRKRAGWTQQPAAAAEAESQSPAKQQRRRVRNKQLKRSPNAGKPAPAAAEQQRPEQHSSSATAPALDAAAKLEAAA